MMNGLALVINRLGETIDALEGEIAERDALLTKCAARMEELEKEIEQLRRKRGR